MTPQRPTSLTTFTKHCPAALDLQEAGAPYDRRIFAVGTAAHDVLHGIGLGVPWSFTVAQLIATGREGVDSEPPLPPDDVFKGRDIALRYLEHVGELGSEAAKYEVGIGWGPSWKMEPYSSATWLRSRLDVVDVVHGDDEDYPAVGLVARDYKSAWPTNAGWLDSAQAKIQLLGLVDQWQRFTDERPDFLRIEAANLRTFATYSRDYWLDEPNDQDLIEGYRRDVEMMVEAANHRPRVARPGVGCLGCPFVLSCGPSRAALDYSPGVDLTDPQQVRERAARAYAISRAHADGWAVLAREATKEDAIDLGGAVVGYQEQTKAIASEDAPEAIADKWFPSTDAGTRSAVVGMLKALKLGAGNVRAAGKVLFDRTQKEERDEWAPLGEKAGKLFGVWPTKETE